MKYIFSYLLLWLFIQVHAQLHDNMWMVKNANSLFHIDFRENSPHISQKAKYLDFFRAHSVFCDKEGNLLYYTNCRQINNKMDSLMENGDSLNVGYNFDGGNNPVQNGSFFLPAPGDSTRCYFLYMYPAVDTIGINPIIKTKLHYALIDMTANNGLGKVLEKNIPLLVGGHDINFNHAGTVRHANGRDWWILVPNRKESKYYRILLTPEGFSIPEEQEIGFSNVPNQWLGYNLFSPDGTRYAVLNYIVHPDPLPEPVTQTLQFYDFDRCTGLLSNPILVDVPPSIYSDIAFSPSGKRFYLTYGTSSSNLAQFDLDASNIQDSWQLIFSCPGGNNYYCVISKALLAPNGKIYVSSVFDTVAYHVIHQPDSLGLACDLELGGFVFPAKHPNQEFSYFPNYRLGPIDGSPCDTLGINNMPVASFFWDATGLEVDFSNVSYYEPTDFLWDFGDPASAGANTSTEVNPNHPFSAPGVYEVCLTASNANGSDTICKLVTVDTLPAPPILPVAAFTWDAVELDVSFTNSSYNLPTSFLWNFGDPAAAGSDTSTAVNPTYAYPAPGSYHTCLIASNMNGSDTLCQLVVVDTLLDTTSMVVQLPHENQVLVRPNPTSHQVTILLPAPLPVMATWSVHDALGRELASTVLPAGQQEAAVELADMVPGLYFWNMENAAGNIGKGKLIVIK